eukprot:Gb_07162 [translate_table: standard]
MWRRVKQETNGKKALLDHVLKTAEKGNPKSVIDAMDEYGRHTRYMNIGNDKWPILDSALHKVDPLTVLELGTYFGQIIDHAGLSSKVQLVQGKFEERLHEVRKFLEEMGTPYFDFIFLEIRSLEAFLFACISATEEEWLHWEGKLHMLRQYYDAY